MIIQLKEKHLCYAWTMIKDGPVDGFLDTATSIKTAVSNNIDGEDALLQVDISPEIIYKVWVIAGLQAEVFCQSINQEIKTILIPQLLAIGT